MNRFTIYCSNLPYSLTEAELRAAFEPYGQVEGVRVIADQLTGRSRGYAFIDMASEDEMARAVAALNNTALNGRMLRCNPANRVWQRGKP